MAVLIETKANSASFLIEIVLITEIEAELSKSNYQASLAKMKKCKLSVDKKTFIPLYAVPVNED